MLKKLLKHYFLILFLLLLAVVRFIENYPAKFEPKDIDTHSFSVSLYEKERLVDNWMDTLLNCVIEKRLSNYVNEHANEIDWLYQEHGLVFTVYYDNRLVYWTNNTISFPDDTVLHTPGFLKLGNAYAEVRTRYHEDICINAFIVVKYEYPYQNEFLTNNYHPSFKNISNNLGIVVDEKNQGQAIYSKEGDYLFSLIKTPGDGFSDKEKLEFVFLLIALLFLLLYARDVFKDIDFSLMHFALFSFTVLALRFILQYYRIPNIVYKLDVFQPEYFATSQLFPSLGELIITISVIAYLVFVFYGKVQLPKLKTGKYKYLFLGLWLFIIFMYGTGSLYAFTHLIQDSSFQFEAYDVLSLSSYSFLGYFILVLLFGGLMLLIDKAVFQLKPAFTYLQVMVGLLVFTLFFGVVSALVCPFFDALTLLFYMVTIAFWFNIRMFRKPKFGAIVILIVLFAAYSTNFIRRNTFEKRVEESKVMAVNLAREKDAVAEVIIGDAIPEIKNDTLIKKYLTEEYFNFEKLYDYLNKQYLSGYLNRYNFQLTLCNKYDSLLVDESQHYWAYCYGFFDNMVKSHGEETSIPNLFYLHHHQSGISYFLKIKIGLGQGWEDVTLFFELISKPNFEVLGYPELLLEKPIDTYENRYLKNYARYSENQLLSSTGEFPYAFERAVYGHLDTDFAFFRNDGFDHVVYNSPKGNSVIVSTPTVRLYNVLISFTYIFFFFFIQITLLLIIGNKHSHFIDIQFTIKNKIVFSMILILFISLLFVGGGTIFYTVRQFENSRYNILSEKIQSVLVELEHKIGEAEDISQISPDYISTLLIKFSNVFYTDINLYNLRGDLVATSREQIFERELTSEKINAIAYRELVLNKKARIVQKEHIGTMEYYSAYVPFINSQNKLIAYLNLPYFSKELLLRQELMRVVVAVINIYAILIIISILVAIYISNRLTEPLRMVQQRIRNIGLGKKNERIDYDGDDEIAELVNEYNRMLDELAMSAKLLAKSERESAWREMARQIAHEIKNPLTPMKLSVQLLEKSYKNNDTDFEERFNKVTQTLIEQIDSLSSIATAFSQFARMPIARFGKVDVVERLHRSAELFYEINNVTVELDLPPENTLFIKADRERILQVFNNLLKNAVQAIPRSSNGKVKVSIQPSPNSVVIEFADNGVGIPHELEDKLFEPNFTTKTSGTGLGLAIVRNIVEELGGAIWFESEIGKGTIFYVSIPVYND